MAVAQAAAVVAPVMVAAAAPSVCLPSPCQSSRRALLSRAPVGSCGLRWLRRRTMARSARRRGSTSRGLVIVDEFGGTYEEGFEDVHAQIVNYFTYKATNTVLHQLYEMNPPAYTWLYNYVVVNDPKEGKHFLRALAKERRDLAERVMITRLHLYGKWIKVSGKKNISPSLREIFGEDCRNFHLVISKSDQKCDHTKMYERISNENLEIMRERLMETVAWPTDDTNTSDKKD